jgi:hypothetical protein
MMDSMTSKFVDMLAQVGFSAETGFKETLRGKLFDKKSNVSQFQRLSEAELDLVSAAGDAGVLRQMEKKDKKETDKR